MNIKAKILIITSAVVFICICAIGYYALSTYHQWGMIIVTQKDILKTARRACSEFKQKEGRYPDSLQELSKHSGEPNYMAYLFIPTNQEYGSLNGLGGFYYNKNTGEIRINLTKPVKSYFFIYIGPSKNEIPCEW